MKTRFSGMGVGCLFFLVLTGCGRAPDLQEITWHDLIRNLADADRVARLDTPTSRLVSSHDPTGGNDDFNQYVRSGPPGWWVIADLKGPGYISRFWFTGAQDGTHGLRMYFDGEETPRIDTTIGEYCGGMDPYRPPLAMYENYCWMNWVPIPYEKSLVVMVQEGSTRPGNWPRLFYQMNVNDLPRDITIKSRPGVLSEADVDVIAGVRETWKQADLFDRSAWQPGVTERLTIPAGESASVALPPGPALVRELNITPNLAAIPTAVARESMLRDVVLNVYWEDAAEPSVASPLGDFFGAFWRRNRYESLYVGMRDDTFYARFPMPYRRAGRVELVNESAHSLSVEVAIEIEPRESLSEAWGYFHADWQRSTPGDVGRPHQALSRSGRGKFVGSMLSVVSADRSWWILEADESIRIDRERAPGWRGTGLEDYFNGGWYYQNAITRLLNGIPFKMPFRVLQYRFHLVDPVHFEREIEMGFERGPDDASRGWMETVAYYYLDQPSAAGSRLLTARDRQPPDDGFGMATAMTEIANLERIGDYRGANDFIDAFLEKYSQFPDPEVLRLRQIAYIERFEGIDVARPLYESFRDTTQSEAAREQVGHLLWFHENPSNALLYAFCSMRTAVFLNGHPVSAVEANDRVFMFRVQVEPGEQILAMQTRNNPYPSWGQVYLRTHYGDVYTTPDWRWAYNPRGNWTQIGFDDSAWPPLGGTGAKGPPEVPYLWVAPHAYVGMQSVAVGIRPTRDLEDRGALVGFRHAFTLPLESVKD